MILRFWGQYASQLRVRPNQIYAPFPAPEKFLHQIIPNRFQRDHCIVILFRASVRGGGEALHTACLERYMGMSALKTPFSHLSSSSQGSHFKQKSLKLRGIARGGAGGESPLVRSSAPLHPPNEMTLFSGVYGEPPFWVPVSPPACLPLLPPHFEKSGYAPGVSSQDPPFQKKKWKF